MNFIRRIINRFRKEYDFPDEFEVWEDVVFNRDKIAIDDRKQRREYITNCLEQLKDATVEVESLQAEYNIITSQLKDMEEIEVLPKDELRTLQNAAERLASLNNARSGYEQKVIPMDENAFQKIDVFYDQVEDGLHKLKEAEE
jgi:conjugal transfer/entry exclusion protein